MSPEGTATSAVIIAIAALVAAVIALSVALNAIRHSGDARDDAIAAKVASAATKERADDALSRLIGYAEATERHREREDSS